MTVHIVDQEEFDRPMAERALHTKARLKLARAELWAKVYAAEYRVSRDDSCMGVAGIARKKALMEAAAAADDFDAYCEANP